MNQRAKEFGLQWANRIIDLHKAYQALERGAKSVTLMDSTEIKGMGKFRGYCAWLPFDFLVRGPYMLAKEWCFTHPTEYAIFIEKGVPGVRIVGELDLTSTPITATLECVDCEGPWTPVDGLTPEAQEALLWFVRFFDWSTNDQNSAREACNGSFA